MSPKVELTSPTVVFADHHPPKSHKTAMSTCFRNATRLAKSTLLLSYKACQTCKLLPMTLFSSQAKQLGFQSEITALKEALAAKNTKESTLHSQLTLLQARHPFYLGIPLHLHPPETLSHNCSLLSALLITGIHGPGQLMYPEAFLSLKSYPT